MCSSHTFPVTVKEVVVAPFFTFILKSCGIGIETILTYCLIIGHPMLLFESICRRKQIYAVMLDKFWPHLRRRFPEMPSRNRCEYLVVGCLPPISSSFFTQLIPAIPFLWLTESDTLRSFFIRDAANIASRSFCMLHQFHSKMAVTTLYCPNLE